MTTAHTCNDGAGPYFGRMTPGCPRCDELIAGAEPVRWSGSRSRYDWNRFDDLRRVAEINDHFKSERHRSGTCGVVCTFGEW